MKIDFDIIIIGSGPAGTSAAYPLLEAGLKVLMVDGGKSEKVPLPKDDFLTSRLTDEKQWRWMIGENFHALKMMKAASPKLRIPTLGYVFDEFMKKNHISGENFTTIGSLATGGLSNAWGTGVACFSKEELDVFPCSNTELEISYATIANRIGISGQADDDLVNYFGIDQWADKPIPLDGIHHYLLNKYKIRKSKFAALGIKLGRTRVALLTRDFNNRSACQQLGNCLWGCSRKSLYTAAYEIPSLKKFDNFTFLQGFVVDKLSQAQGYWSVEGEHHGEKIKQSISAKKVLLAAGTLASSRLALQSLKLYEPLPLLSCPTAAFMLWLPRFLGAKRQSVPTVGQLGFTLPLQQNILAFGATFLTTGINTSEFLKYLPMKKRTGIRLCRNLLSSCVAGNLFLPGHLTDSTVTLDKNQSMVVRGKYSEHVSPLMQEAAKKLRSGYSKLGAYLIPKSFTLGPVGGDVHYSGTFPMRESPNIGETTSDGQVFSLSNLYIIDGACLPLLPAKSHTFTIMANADRIARRIVSSINMSGEGKYES